MSTNFANMLGQTISFEVYPSAIIGTKFQNAIVRGLVDHSGVTEFNPAVMHANVYPSIPAGKIVDDFRKYNYLRLELPSGSTVFVGLPWIIESTVQVISNQDLVITIPKYGDYEKREYIRRMLLNNSITEFTMDTK